MSSANSVQHQRARQAFRQKLKEVAQILRSLEENRVAVSLEALSESPDLSLDPIALNVRKDLIKASTDKLRQNPAPLSDGLSQCFQQLGLSEEQNGRLLPLVQAWERQKTALVRIAAQEAPRWEKGRELFRGLDKRPNAPSTAVARTWWLMSKIEDTAMSALHRRLLLISINEAIETEAKELSMKTKRVQCIDKDLGAVSRKLSKERNSPGIRLRAESDAVKRRRTESVAELEHKETTLTEERGRLKDEIENYPKGKPPRWRVTRKIYNDISGIKGLSPEERKRAGDRFSDYAQLGRRYHQLHPLGVLIFLGKTSIMFEQTPWTSLEYDAMLSYWQYFSGIYHLCQLYSPLLERLKRRWSPLSTGPMEQEVDTPRLSLASPPAITAPPEDRRDHPEIPRVPTTTDSSFGVSVFSQNSINSPPDTSAFGQESTINSLPDNSAFGQQTDSFFDAFGFGQENTVNSLPDNSAFGQESRQQNVTDPYFNAFGFGQESQQNVADPYFDAFGFGQGNTANSFLDNSAFGQENITGRFNAHVGQDGSPRSLQGYDSATVS